MPLLEKRLTKALLAGFGKRISAAIGLEYGKTLLFGLRKPMTPEEILADLEAEHARAEAKALALEAKLANPNVNNQRAGNRAIGLRQKATLLSETKTRLQAVDPTFDLTALDEFITAADTAADQAEEDLTDQTAREAALLARAQTVRAEADELAAMVAALRESIEGPEEPPGEEEPPPPPPDGSWQVSAVIPNHDSCKVRYPLLEGALDYRAYPQNHTHAKKYAGGQYGDEIDCNGVTHGEVWVLEAVDRLGPFQYFDGSLPHHELHSLNGHGPSDAVPVVIASTTFTAQTTAHPIEAVPVQDRIFFHPYEANVVYPRSDPFATVDRRTGTISGQEGNWTDPSGIWDPIFSLDLNVLETTVFEHQGHIMDIVQDGGTTGTGQPPLTQWGDLIFPMQDVVDLSGGKILHFMQDVDLHFPSGRRWWGIMVTHPDDYLLHPKLMPWDPSYHPSALREHLLDWFITGTHQLTHWMQDGNSVPITRQAHGAGPDSFNWCQRSGVWAPGTALPGYPHLRRNLNGEIWDTTTGSRIDWGEARIDNKVRLQMYVSQTRVQIWEDGRLLRDAAINFPLAQCKIKVRHGMYHSDLERQEIALYAPDMHYYRLRMPHHDERHWDNSAAWYVDAFPTPPDPAYSGITTTPLAPTHPV